MGKEAYKRTNATGPPGDTVLISRKEHVFGKNFYSTKAQFCDKGRTHDIVIECQTEGLREPRLSVRIDKQLVVQVKHLLWKFRGNQSILVDGLPVEMFWDVHDWFFSPSSGHAVFLFRTRLSNEEPWHKLNSYSFRQKECQGQGLGFSLLLYAWKNE